MQKVASPNDVVVNKFMNIGKSWSVLFNKEELDVIKESLKVVV
jgi:hypothetical protein